MGREAPIRSSITRAAPHLDLGAKGGEHVDGHAYVRARLHGLLHKDAHRASQGGAREEKTAHILRGYVTRQPELTGTKRPRQPEREPSSPVKNSSVTNKLVAQGKEGPFGEPPLPIEGGIHTQGAGEREHEAQGRGGLLAVEKDNLLGTNPSALTRNGSYPEASARAGNTSAERLEAPHRGVDVI